MSFPPENNLSLPLLYLFLSAHMNLLTVLFSILYGVCSAGIPGLVRCPSRVCIPWLVRDNVDIAGILIPFRGSPGNESASATRLGISHMLLVFLPQTIDLLLLPA